MIPVFLGNHVILFGNPVGINWNYANIGKRCILLSFELRNTGTRTILTRFWIEKYWNTNHFYSVSNWEMLEHEPFWFSLELRNAWTRTSLMTCDPWRADGWTGGRVGWLKSIGKKSIWGIRILENLNLYININVNINKYVIYIYIYILRVQIDPTSPANERFHRDLTLSAQSNAIAWRANV